MFLILNIKYIKNEHNYAKNNKCSKITINYFLIRNCLKNILNYFFFEKNINFKTLKFLLLFFNFTDG